MGRIFRYNGKFYDTGTSNKSFLQVAKDLKTLGIANWYFMLEIKDPSLCSIDPYATNKEGHSTCTKDQVDRITLECINNMWYYLREICRIPTPGIAGGVSYKANRGNIAQAWCYYHGIDSWLCLPRQQGKTKSALAIQAWAYSFGTRDTTFIFVNKDGENAKTNLRDLYDQIDLLPEYLRYESIMEEDGKITKQRKNATSLEHPITHVRIIVKPKPTSYEHALSLARGLSASTVHFDEPEFTPYIDVVVENSVSTFNTSAKNAKDAGAVYGRIFTCTPGDPDTDPGRRAEKLLQRNAIWREDFYNMDIEDIRKEITTNDKSGIVYIEYSYQQIGLSKEWFKHISSQIGNKDTVRREILLQRLRGSNFSPWDRDKIERIIDLAKKPIETIMLKKYYRLDVYEKLVRYLPYIVGVDCASGTVKDNNALTIIHPYTLKPVAELECSFIGLPDFEDLLRELVRKYIPNAVLCIERNNTGIGVIQHLMKTDIAGRIYFDRDKELAEEQMKELEEASESMLKARAKLDTYYGVWTGPTSRKVMMSILSDRITDFPNDFITQNITRDISKLVQKGDKIQAASGWHDDSIMSYLIGMYVYCYGNNLDVFGINKGDYLYTKEPNKGLNRGIEEVDLYTLPSDVREIIADHYAKERKIKEQEAKERADLIHSEKEMRTLIDHGLIRNQAYENSVGMAPIGDFSPEFDTPVDMSIFDELNGW